MKTIVVVTRDGHMARALSELVRTVASEVHTGPLLVLSASSADEVLDIMAHERPDILITEHMLAGMTGVDLVRWLGTGLRGAITILLTNDSRMLADPWKFAGPEINQVLPRPLGRGQLKSALHRWLGTAPAPDEMGVKNAIKNGS